MQKNKFNKNHNVQATLQKQTQNSCGVLGMHKWIFDDVIGDVA